MLKLLFIPLLAILTTVSNERLSIVMSTDDANHHFIIRNSLFAIQDSKILIPAGNRTGYRVMNSEVKELRIAHGMGQKPTPDKPSLLLNATVHLGDGSTIPNAALAISGDTISLLGDARVLRIDPSYFDITKLYGTHVYPGRIISGLRQPTYQPAFAKRLAVPLAGDSVLVPQLLTEQPLRTGSIATLVVADTLLSETTAPHVLHAFVRGQAVALPTDSEEY